MNLTRQQVAAMRRLAASATGALLPTKLFNSLIPLGLVCEASRIIDGHVFQGRALTEAGHAYLKNLDTTGDHQ